MEILKIILNTNSNKKPQVIDWSNDLDDYIVQGFDGLSLDEANDAIDELNRITQRKQDVYIKK